MRIREFIDSKGERREAGEMKRYKKQGLNVCGVHVDNEFNSELVEDAGSPEPSDSAELEIKFHYAWLT